MNKVILIGRLTRDPDVRYTQDQKAVARYTLAVDRRYKKEGDPSLRADDDVIAGRVLAEQRGRMYARRKWQ